VIDLDDLEAAAKAATQGSYRSAGFEDDNDLHWLCVDGGNPCYPREAPMIGGYYREANQKYALASNPNVILELIARLRAAEAIARDLAKYPPSPTHPCPMCGLHPLVNGDTATLRHTESCPWRRAVEAQPRGATLMRCPSCYAMVELDGDGRIGKHSFNHHGSPCGGAGHESKR